VFYNDEFASTAAIDNLIQYIETVHTWRPGVLTSRTGKCFQSLSFLVPRMRRLREAKRAMETRMLLRLLSSAFLIAPSSIREPVDRLFKASLKLQECKLAISAHYNWKGRTFIANSVVVKNTTIRPGISVNKLEYLPGYHSEIRVSTWSTINPSEEKSLCSDQTVMAMPLISWKAALPWFTGIWEKEVQLD